MQYIPDEAVLTTQSVIDGAMISYAYHHPKDGMWEFYPDEDWDFDDIRVVAMSEIVMKDSRLLDVVLNISDNEAAFYDKGDSQWIISPFDYSE